MCIRDRLDTDPSPARALHSADEYQLWLQALTDEALTRSKAVSYTHLRAHETVLDLVCRLLLEKKKHNQTNIQGLM